MRSVRWLGLLALYVGAQTVGLALANPFRSEGLASTSNPQSPTAPLFILAIIVVAPLGILLFARRRGGLAAIRQVILVGIAGSLYVTLYATFSLFPLGVVLLPPYGAELVLDPPLALAAAASAGIYLALLMEPQWYVVDLAGFVAGGALIAILGISFGILPAFILLGALMVYDAIAVYRTKHMVSLADVVTDMKLPILMVMPDAPGYDYTQARSLQEQRQQPVEERAAMFMGLGDVVIPGTLVVSSFVWLPVAPTVLGVGANLVVAVGALLGSLGGYALLMRIVARGNPQAGLPFLNGGAIAGYVIAYLLLYRSFTLGLTGGL
ncbi:MAG TPA: presenilin family intramembrane aspartyl protease PSH [Thermoplasmata archaeon]|nr:presenilin family intramembrane aspartyl protease PSH [Thermoplasmata archaeon]